MDEPFAALDEITRFKLNDDLLRLQRELGCTVVFVTHSVYESVYLSSRIVVMAARPGRVVAEIQVDAPARRDEDVSREPRLCATLPARVRGAARRHGPGRAPMSDALAADPPRSSLPEATAAFDWQPRPQGRPAPRRARSRALGLGILRARNAVPPYILPAPSLDRATLVKDWPVLFASLLVTLKTTFSACCLAVVGGVALAVLLSLSRIVEYSLYPYAVMLQVTPVVAISPLLLIYLPQELAVLACAWIVAFFPVLSNTTLGLQSVDRNLLELFDLYGATRPQWRAGLPRTFPLAAEGLWYLRRPAALPYFLAGLKIAGGLSLIGAVVAEIAAGSAGAGSGLAYRIVESQFRLNIPRLFAALALLALTGIVIFLASPRSPTSSCGAGTRAPWRRSGEHEHQGFCRAFPMRRAIA